MALCSRMARCKVIHQRWRQQVMGNMSVLSFDKFSTWHLLKHEFSVRLFMPKNFMTKTLLGFECVCWTGWGDEAQGWWRVVRREKVCVISKEITDLHSDRLSITPGHLAHSVTNAHSKQPCLKRSWKSSRILHFSLVFTINLLLHCSLFPFVEKTSTKRTKRRKGIFPHPEYVYGRERVCTYGYMCVWICLKFW